MKKMCPFCGSTDIEIKEEDDSAGEYCVLSIEPRYSAICNECGARGPDESNVDDASAAWEKRFINVCPHCEGNIL